MSTVDGQGAPRGSPSREPADLKLEAVVIPVARVDSDWPDCYAEYMVREQSG